MKMILLILAVVAASLTAYALFVNNDNDSIEEYDYVIENKQGPVEIRRYNACYFNTVNLPRKNYSDNASGGFRILAGYIFGGNDEQRKIAMTSPVVMEMDSQVKMKFMVPKSESIDQLPKPNDSRVNLEYTKAKRVAIIRFGGWANDVKIEKYVNRLKDWLDENQIPYNSGYSFMGYNPPYQLIGRRNEIMIDLD